MDTGCDGETAGAGADDENVEDLGVMFKMAPIIILSTRRSKLGEAHFATINE